MSYSRDSRKEAYAPGGDESSPADGEARSKTRRVVVQDAANNEEYEIADPTMYVTRVINPETEVRRKLMAKELADALQDQIASNRRKKEGERAQRIADEIKEEERYKKLFKTPERKVGRAKARVQEEPDPAPPAPNEDAAVAAAAEPSDESLPASQPTAESKPKHKEDSSNLPDAGFDFQLKQLQRELLVRDQDFQNELTRLRQYARATSTVRDQTEHELVMLRERIGKKRDPFFAVQPSFVRQQNQNDELDAEDSYELRHRKKYRSPQREERGLSRFGKMHFTDYKPIMGRQKLRREEPAEEQNWKHDPEEALMGDSHMIPWLPTQRTFQERSEMVPTVSARVSVKKPPTDNDAYEPYRIVPQTKLSAAEVPSHSRYQKLDDLLKEFLDDSKLKQKAEDEIACEKENESDTGAEQEAVIPVQLDAMTKAESSAKVVGEIVEELVASVVKATDTQERTGNVQHVVEPPPPLPRTEPEPAPEPAVTPVS